MYLRFDWRLRPRKIEIVTPHPHPCNDALREQRSAALESVTEAAAAGELYPFSAEEEGGVELDMYSDEEAAGGGLWSAAGTGTEGEVC